MSNSKKSPKKLITDKQFLLASLLILLLSIFVLGLSLKTQNDTKRIYNYSADPAKPFVIGQQVQMGVVRLTVDKVVFAKGQPHFVAPVGRQYAVVTLSIKNRSDKPINFAPASDTYIKNSSGNVSYVTPYPIANPFHAGEIPPGEVVTGELSYLVSKSAPNKLFIDAIWSGGVLSFAL